MPHELQTTWKPFDTTSYTEAIAFLRNEVNQPIPRAEWHRYMTAAVDLMQTMYDELVALRAASK